MATSLEEAAIFVNPLYFKKKSTIFQKSYINVTYIHVTFIIFAADNQSFQENEGTISIWIAGRERELHRPR